MVSDIPVLSYDGAVIAVPSPFAGSLAKAPGPVSRQEGRIVAIRIAVSICLKIQCKVESEKESNANGDLASKSLLR